MTGRALRLIVACVAVATLSPRTARPSPGPTPAAMGLGDAWRWVHFTHASGLPSEFVTAAVDVPGDGLWVITRNGVARFDGYRWKDVPVTGAPTARATAIAADGDQGVVAIASGKLLAGNATGLHVVAVTDNDKAVPLETCARAAAGPPLLLGVNGVVYEWDGHTVRRHAPAHGMGLVHEMQQAGPRAVWAATDKGLWGWDGIRWRLRLAAPHPMLGAVVELADESAVAYLNSPKSVEGVWEWRGESAPRRVERSAPTPIQSMAVPPGASLRDLVVVYRTGEVLTGGPGNWSALPSLGGTLVDAQAVGFLPNHDLWVATDHGLHLCRRSSSRWESTAIPRPDDRNSVNAIVVKPDGRLVLGTGRGVVDLGPDRDFPDVVSEANGLPVTVTGLALDGRGRLWATSGDGFPGARWRDEAGRWHAAHLDPDLDRSYLHRVMLDSHGAVWFLGLSSGHAAWDDPAFGPGAFRLSAGPDGAEHIEHWGPAQGLPSGRVYGFAEGPDGSYWFATAGGLSRWRQGTWTHWTTAEGLKSNRVFTVAVDQSGRAWFGHQEWLGVGWIENGRPVYASVEDGLATDAVWEIQIDQQDRPWVSGEGGVSMRRDGAWTAFGRESGLTHTRFWPVLPAGHRVYLGSMGGGLTVLDLAEQEAPPPIVVAESAAPEEAGAVVQWRAFAWWGEVEPEGVLTRVRLDGGPWTTWSVERRRRFTNLSPGAHMVAFESRGPLGRVNVGIPPLLVNVEPPLVRRPAFFVPVGMLTILVAGLLVVLGVRQRRHHRDLRAGEQQLARTFQASPLATAITRLEDGKLLEVNQALLAIAGRPREELLGKTALEAGLLTEGYERQPITEALQTGAPVPPFTLRARGAQGQALEMLAYSDAVDFGGTPAVLTQMLDVTEQRRLEDQLRQAQKMESIGRLAGGVAHDFNNLLTVIVGNASLLELELPDGDPRLAEIEQIKIAGERAERLTRQLLAFARKQVVEPKVLNVNEVVLSTDRMLRRLIGEDIELVTLPSADLEFVVIDPNQLDQVIMNMAVNARDAMPGGGTLTIRTQNVDLTEREARRHPEAKAGRYVRLSIADTGTGMDAAIRSRLFEPFFTTKEPGKGTGLGLATCYGIVRQAGGHILIESEIGRGTTFHVDLPPAAPEKQPGEIRERPAETRGGAETILLVEDEVQVRKLAAGILRSRGYEVLEAGNGPEALQLAEAYRGQIDILVTDIVMPQMRGTELSGRLRASRHGVKVLYMSGYTDDDRFSQEAGAERLAFLAKPFTPSALARRVREILDEGDVRRTLF